MKEKIKKSQILDINLSEYEELGNSDLSFAIKEIELQLPDILDEQNLSDPMNSENWDKLYYFWFKKELYSFCFFDSGRSDDPGCNYGEVSEIDKIIEYEIVKDEISFNEFLEIEGKLEIRYGTITEVEKMEKSDKMLKLQVDFGEENTRTVMTNIGNKLDRTHYLVGLQFPFITNLAPAKIMGVKSTAMIMIVENEDGQITWPKIGYPNGAKLF